MPLPAGSSNVDPAEHRRSTSEQLDKVKQFLAEASAQGAGIVCFPEAWLPGGLLVQEIRPEEATGLLAARYAPDRYRESLGEKSDERK